MRFVSVWSWVRSPLGAYLLRLVCHDKCATEFQPPWDRHLMNTYVRNILITNLGEKSPTPAPVYNKQANGFESKLNSRRPIFMLPYKALNDIKAML